MAKKRAVTPRNLVNTSLGIRLSSHEKLCAERMALLIKQGGNVNGETLFLKRSMTLLL